MKAKRKKVVGVQGIKAKMKKEAIAVYNPQDHIGKVIQDTYYDKYERNLTWQEVEAFTHTLFSTDGLSDKIAERISYFCRVIFDSDNTGHLYIPCHLIELRDILRYKKKVGTFVAAFENDTALRLLQEYDTLLVVNRDKLPSPDHEIGFYIYNDVIVFGNSLVRVLTRERMDSIAAKETERIVAEEYPDATVYPLSDVPGISVSKVAKVMQKFEVNMPTLGIVNEKHNGENDKDAVNQALYKKWRATKRHFRSAEFTVEYWLESGFWNQIVSAIGKPREILGSVKTAEATTLCGTVIRKRYAVGSNSERDAFMFITPKTEYVLRISEGNSFYDERLEKMVGQTICGIGLLKGDTFIMSSWNKLVGDKEDGIVKMKREEPQEATIFQEGDRVRKRNRGISFKQIIGVVNKIDKNLMYVKWDDIKDTEVFKLTDTVQIHARLEKI